jgi:GxxExxY protein
MEPISLMSVQQKGERPHPLIRLLPTDPRQTFVRVASRASFRWENRVPDLAMFCNMLADRLIEEELTHSIIGAFYDVYNAFGFGFLEHVYLLALERELIARKHRVAREVSVVVTYKGDELCTQRLDMVVDDKVNVEIKSTQDLHPAANRQLYSYLRGTNLEVGLLFHFGRRPGFYRLVCCNRRSAPDRDLEHVHRLPPEHPNGDVAPDPSA